MSSATSSSISFGQIDISLSEFAGLVERHLEAVSNTVQLEADASSLAGNMDAALLDSFIRGVCRWGGYPGIAGRILKQNDVGYLQDRFALALAALNSVGPDADRARDALVALNGIKGLGTPSFASKHLRFLNPRICPVLDRVIHRNCGYTFGPNGYSAYAKDCAAVAATLDAAGIPDPFPGRSGWFAADVDAAIFAHIRWQSA
jgi:hypothetical protein